MGHAETFLLFRGSGHGFFLPSRSFVYAFSGPDNRTQKEECTMDITQNTVLSPAARTAVAAVSFL
jgi:hypothetical protein